MILVPAVKEVAIWVGYCEALGFMHVPLKMFFFFQGISVSRISLAEAPFVKHENTSQVRKGKVYSRHS